MTTPSPQNLASFVDPRTREYIDARISQEMKAARDDISSLRTAVLALREAIHRDHGNLAAQVNDVAALVNLNPARASRLRALLEEDENEN